MPTARHGLSRTYVSVVSIACFAPSWTCVPSWPSMTFALSSLACTWPFTSVSLVWPSDCTVLSNSCASVTTFWMSRAIGLLWPFPMVLALRIFRSPLLVRFAMDVRAPGFRAGALPPAQIRQAGARQLSAPGAARRRVDPIHAWDESDRNASAAADMRQGRRPTALELGVSYDGFDFHRSKTHERETAHGKLCHRGPRRDPRPGRVRAREDDGFQRA